MRRPTACILGLALADAAAAQLRIATWNVTNYDGAGTRDPAFRTTAYGSYQGRRFAPDLILGQEIESAQALADFVAVLNTAAGSPGDWDAAPFVDGPDTDQVLFYRASRVQYLGSQILAAGGPAPNHPRHLMRFDIRPVGYTGPAATIACICSHMKAGSLQSDQDRRLLEAQRIRNHLETLDPQWNFVLGADLNIQTSAQAAYQELVGSQPSNAGRVFDPIRTPGDWNNNADFRIVHTQDPATQMDDRFDQLLLSASLLNGRAFDYIGSLSAPYSAATWDDPNHSYRAWGNDGTSFDDQLTINGNAMVGGSIAQAIITTASGNGHVPVFLDLRVPPEVASPIEIDFGEVPQGGLAEASIEVTNAGDTVLWTETGIAHLRYTLAATTGFAAPPGEFLDAAGGAGVVHTLTMNTASPGPKSGTLTINSDAPDQPVREVALVGVVVPPSCYPDCNTDGALTVADFGCFQTAFVQNAGYADCNGDGVWTVTDFGCFQTRFVQGCP